MKVLHKPIVTTTEMPDVVLDGDVRPIAPNVDADNLTTTATPTTTSAPLPSAQDFARRAAPLAGVPLTSNLGARISALTGGAGAIDGSVALARRLDEIERMTKAGERVVCVFDLDNTIFDTRHRTLHAAHEYDRQNGTHWFDGLTADACRVDGRATATALGLPNDVVEAFTKLWDVEFWNPKHLEKDVPVKAMVDLVNECMRRGAEICFLTGRCDKFVHPLAPLRGEQSFRADTHAQLKRAGIDVDDAHLALKPNLTTWTPQYKQGELQAWWHDAEIGMFVTEGRRDLEHLAKNLPGLCQFRLDCSFEDGGPACRNIPALPRAF